MEFSTQPCSVFDRKIYRLQHGLTLVELLVVIAVLGILLGMAAPSFDDMLLNHRQAAQVNQLVGSLALARSEAVKRGQWVVMCKSQDGQQCTNQGHWDQGWIMFEDRNRNRQLDSDETLIHVFAGSEQIQLRYASFPSSNHVIYYPTGLSLGNGTFTFCDKRGAGSARAVILAKSGRVRSSHMAANGGPLQC